MKTNKLVLALGMVLAMISFCIAAETVRVADIIDVKGGVQVKTLQGSWQVATAGMTLNQGDIIRTEKNSSALLNVDGNGETASVEIKENTQLKLAELKTNKAQATQTTMLDLAVGEILIKAQKLHSEKSKFEVRTPTSIVGVRGTTFSVAVEAVE